MLIMPLLHHSHFNPRSHEGSDLRQSASTCQKSFQSTLPRGERHNWLARYLRYPGNFNPRSHEGSDKAISCKNKRKCKISIHAPTRGATLFQVARAAVKSISIHAPTRGATSRSASILCLLAIISIHAPTRGAT